MPSSREPGRSPEATSGLPPALRMGKAFLSLSLRSPEPPCESPYSRGVLLGPHLGQGRAMSNNTRPAPTCDDLLQGPTRPLDLQTVGCIPVFKFMWFLKIALIALPKGYLGGTWAALPRECEQHKQCGAFLPLGQGWKGKEHRGTWCRIGLPTDRVHTARAAPSGCGSPMCSESHLL